MTPLDSTWIAVGGALGDRVEHGQEIEEVAATEHGNARSPLRSVAAVDADLVG